MNPVDDTRLYTIGELARRTGLSVKTIRFYSDSGVVPPTDRTHSGYRLYDVESVGRLELVRTLRELGAGLDDVRGVLARETTLSLVAKANLDLVEVQMRALRTRRAVLRAVVKQGSTTEEVRLMNKLASMSDEERNRIIEEFWNEITEGLDLQPEFEQWIRSARPTLPDDPSSEQVEAWIELAELVRSEDFRASVRALYQQQSDRRGSGKWAEEAQSPDAAREWLTKLTEIREAYEAGVPADSKQARAHADSIARKWAEDHGKTDGPALRDEIADRYEEYDHRVERYWELLYTINGWPRGASLGPATTWLAAALRASAR